MSMEATMIIVDNSDWSRNGDYLPTRWEAQQDAVALIANAKFQAHAESSVGLMTMAGKQVEILATPINDSGKILSCLHGIKQSGSIYFSNALQIAHLALKHRLNVNQKQRIIAFIASPLAESLQNLVALAKKLKKNMIAVDIINIGEMDNQHTEKLTQFIENVNSSDNSHLININPGINLLSDSLYGTPIFGGSEAAGGVINQGGSNQVDPNLDPELAMAMRISLEEEKERQRKIKDDEEKQKSEEQKNVNVQEEPKNNVAPVQESIVKMQIEEEVPLKNEEDMDEEELLKRAKELSLQDPTNILQEQEKEKPQPKKEEQVFQDENFVKELLGMIPEVDQNNEEIKKAVEMLQKSKEEQKKDENEKK